MQDKTSTNQKNFKRKKVTNFSSLELVLYTVGVVVGAVSVAWIFTSRYYRKVVRRNLDTIKRKNSLIATLNAVQKQEFDAWVPPTKYPQSSSHKEAK